jgi:hypothetical protein
VLGLVGAPISTDVGEIFPSFFPFSDLEVLGVVVLEDILLDFLIPEVSSTDSTLLLSMDFLI